MHRPLTPKMREALTAAVEHAEKEAAPGDPAAGRPALADTHPATRDGLAARGLAHRAEAGHWELTDTGFAEGERIREECEHDANEAAARTPAPAAEEGPFGVFAGGLCVEVAHTREEADGYAEYYLKASENDDVVVRPLCREHAQAEQPRGDCEECLTDAEAQEDGAGGRAPAPAGAAAVPGSEPAVAHDADVRAAVAALTAAGHTPAALSGEYDESTCTATGFFVHPRGDEGDGAVYVYHLENGQMVDRSRSGGGDWWRKELRAYRAALAEAGWRTAKPSACVRAYR